jgi:hypothetical protein
VSGSCARTTLFFLIAIIGRDEQKIKNLPRISADCRGSKANWLLFYPRAFAKIRGKVFFLRVRLIEDNSLPLIIFLAQPTDLPAGTCLWCRLCQKNSCMAIYKRRPWCMDFHTPQLHVRLFSVGGEITRPLKERL